MESKIQISRLESCSRLWGNGLPAAYLLKPSHRFCWNSNLWWATDSKTFLCLNVGYIPAPFVRTMELKLLYEIGIPSVRMVGVGLIKSTGKCTGVAFSGTACNLWGSGFLSFSFLASFLRKLPRNNLEGVGERPFRGRLRAGAVYDVAVGDSISRSLKWYGLILALWLTIDNFAVVGCGIDSIKWLLASLVFLFLVVSPDTHSLCFG